MPTNLSEVLRQIVAGDVSQLATVRASNHADLVEASRQGPKLQLTKQALAQVLSAWKRGDFSDKEVQEWASFVRRGYAKSSGAQPIRPIDIQYDPLSEDVIVEIISRLDELGDTIDGTISEAELKKMLQLLVH